MIDPNDTVLDMNKVLELKEQTIGQGIVKLIERRDLSEFDITNEYQVKISCSGRKRDGTHAIGQIKYNPNQSTKVKLHSNPKNFPPVIINCLLSMKNKEICYVELTPDQHKYPLKENIFFRIEIINAEEKKVSFSQLPLEERYAILEEEKVKGDFNYRKKNFIQAKKHYCQALTYFEQFQKKQLARFNEDQMNQHKEKGRKVVGNYFSSMIMSKDYHNSKKAYNYAEKFLDCKYNRPILEKYLKIVIKTGDKPDTREIFKRLIEITDDISEKEKLEKKRDKALYSNVRLGKAFRKMWEEEQAEINREKTYNNVKDSIKLKYE